MRCNTSGAELASGALGKSSTTGLSASHASAEGGALNDTFCIGGGVGSEVTTAGIICADVTFALTLSDSAGLVSLAAGVVSAILGAYTEVSYFAVIVSGASLLSGRALNNTCRADSRSSTSCITDTSFGTNAGGIARFAFALVRSIADLPSSTGGADVSSASIGQAGHSVRSCGTSIAGESSSTSGSRTIADFASSNSRCSNIGNNANSLGSGTEVSGVVGNSGVANDSSAVSSGAFACLVDSANGS